MATETEGTMQYEVQEEVATPERQAAETLINAISMAELEGVAQGAITTNDSDMLRAIKELYDVAFLWSHQTDIEFIRSTTFLTPRQIAYANAMTSLIEMTRDYHALNKYLMETLKAYLQFQRSDVTKGDFVHTTLSPQRHTTIRFASSSAESIAERAEVQEREGQTKKPVVDRGFER